LHAEDFVTLERVTRRSFNLGVSRACANFIAMDWSLQKVLQEAEMVGKHVWINASSIDDLKSSVSNFLKARRKIICHVSLFIVALSRGSAQRIIARLEKDSNRSKRGSSVFVRV
jgi:hypothetical protein